MYNIRITHCSGEYEFVLIQELPNTMRDMIGAIKHKKTVVSPAHSHIGELTLQFLNVPVTCNNDDALAVTIVNFKRATAHGGKTKNAKKTLALREGFGGFGGKETYDTACPRDERIIMAIIMRILAEVISRAL